VLSTLLLFALLHTHSIEPPNTFVDHSVRPFANMTGESSLQTTELYQYFQNHVARLCHHNDSCHTKDSSLCIYTDTYKQNFSYQRTRWIHPGWIYNHVDFVCRCSRALSNQLWPRVPGGNCGWTFQEETITFISELGSRFHYKSVRLERESIARMRKHEYIQKRRSFLERPGDFCKGVNAKEKKSGVQKGRRRGRDRGTESEHDINEADTEVPNLIVRITLGT